MTDNLVNIVVNVFLLSLVTFFIVLMVQFIRTVSKWGDK